MQRLWAPIVQKPGINDGADPGILPETEAFKAKIKVLSAWFHQGVSTIAPDVASSNQVVHGDDRLARMAGGAGQVRRAVSAGSKARRRGGGGAKGLSAGPGAGRRTGGDAAARKVAGGGGLGADDGGSISTTTAG